MVLADAGVAANESADGAAEEAEDGIEADSGYSAAYVALNFASTAEVDLYADAQAAAALTTALSAVSAANPGRRALRVTHHSTCHLPPRVTCLPRATGCRRSSSRWG